MAKNSIDQADETGTDETTTPDATTEGGDDQAQPTAVDEEKPPVYPYVVVRTNSAGAFVGYLESRTGKEVRLLRARRLWEWRGAASLSGIAATGVSQPNECKFPAPVDIVLTEAIEIIDATPEARASIEAVPVWHA